MTNSFLRKKSRRNANTSNNPSLPDNTDPTQQQTIHHSLSLPDLTTPLLDPASWEALPKPNPHSTTPRARKISISARDPNSPIQFHRPFTPWQVVNPPVAATSGMEGGDFRKSAMNWEKGRNSGYTTGSGVSGVKRRGKGKGVGKLNLVVVGGKGVGKSSLANLLLRTMSDDNTPDTHTHGQDLGAFTTTPVHTPKTIIQPTAYPTVRPIPHTILTSNPSFEKTQLRIIDTPGLELGEDDTLKEKERERGMAGLMRLLEERFAVALKEESRVVRRKTGGVDDLIHLVIYLLDARRILKTSQSMTVRIDWSCVGVFDAPFNPPPDQPTPAILPRLSQIDIGIILRLSRRANVLPVLGHIDALTMAELEIVKNAVRRDLSNAFAGEEGLGFGILGLVNDVEEDTTRIEEDEETDQDPGSPIPADLHDPRPITPASSRTPETIPAHLPYAIFASDENTGGPRKYAWGNADVLDPNTSDFLLIQEAIFGTHARALRSSTREVLYEQYRTEMLLANQYAKVQMSEREQYRPGISPANRYGKMAERARGL